MLLALVVLGNYLRWSLFFRIDFLFGTIAVWLVLNFYGQVWGAVAAITGAICTYFLWNHPYAIIIFAAEYLFVAWFYMRQQQRNLVLLTALYWVVIGMLLVWLFYGQVSSYSPPIVTWTRYNSIAAMPLAFKLSSSSAMLANSQG